jgi:hypothetical protein
MQSSVESLDSISPLPRQVVHLIVPAVTLIVLLPPGMGSFVPAPNPRVQDALRVVGHDVAHGVGERVASLYGPRELFFGHERPRHSPAAARAITAN